MAEGDLTQINSGSDAFEYMCSPCGEDDIREQAVKYCPMCHEYLCATCTRHHGRQKATRTHALMDSDASMKTNATMVTKCPDHPDYDIDMYCGQHDMVYCAKCIAKNHRTCSGVTDLEEVKFSSNQKNKIVHMKIDTRIIQKQLEKVKQKTQTNIYSVKEQRYEVISQIEEMERYLVEHIRTLKNKALKSLETEYILVNEELESNISMVDEVKQKTKEANFALKTIDSVDVKQHFIQAKLLKKTVYDALEIVGKSVSEGCQFLRFKVNEEFKSSIITSTMFGYIQRESEGKGLAKLASEKCKASSKREVKGQDIVATGLQALTPSMLAPFPPQEQKQMLGERMFPLIEQMYPDLACRITGMLLEIDNSELLHMLNSRESLKAKVEEAVALLQAHLAKEAAANQQFESRQTLTFKQPKMNKQFLYY